MPAAYLFDMDGLLLDTERLSLQAFLECAEPFGLEQGDIHALFLSMIGNSRASNLQRMQMFADAQGIELEPFHQHAVAIIKERMRDDVPLRPTVRATIEMLARQGAHMAVVTSTEGDLARHHLNQVGLLSHFRCVVGGDEVSANKPDPAPYLTAAFQLEVDPCSCAAFEDSDSGITAAMRAGCHGVQIPDLRPDARTLPDVGQLFAETLADAVLLAQEHIRNLRVKSAI